MLFAKRQKCDECGVLWKNLHPYKDKFLCWKCYKKKREIIYIQGKIVLTK